MDVVITGKEAMRKNTTAVVVVAALSITLLTGCSEQCPNKSPMYYNTEDGRYHYENVGGPLVPAEDIRAGCGADQQGDTIVDVDIDAPKVKPVNPPKTRTTRKAK